MREREVVRLADGWCWFVLRGVRLAGCWWLVCSERKVPLTPVSRVNGLQECPVKASEPVELSTGVVYAIMKRERGRAGQQRMINPAVEMRCAGAMHVMDS
jgi:hypothetical protein